MATLSCWVGLGFAAILSPVGGSYRGVWDITAFLALTLLLATGTVQAGICWRHRLQHEAVC